MGSRRAEVFVSSSSTGGPPPPIDNDAVIFDDAVPAAMVNIRSDRASNQGAIDNTKAGITQLGSNTGAALGATGNYSTISGGDQNAATADKSTVGGGFANSATAMDSTVAGGNTNTASSLAATVGGGATNTASGALSTVAGGNNNTASALGATVGGGVTNASSSTMATCAGGTGNTASNDHAFVGGGNTNTASGLRSVVCGGIGNAATNSDAAVCGGTSNTASGLASSVSGGNTCTASGSWASAGGLGGLATRAAEQSYGSRVDPIAAFQTQRGAIDMGVQVGGAGPTVLTDSSNNEFDLVDGMTYSFRVTVTGSRVDAQGSAMFVYDVLAHASGGVAVIDNINLTLNVPNGTTWAFAFGTPGGLTFRMVFAGAVGQTVSALAKLEYSSLPGF